MILEGFINVFNPYLSYKVKLLMSFFLSNTRKIPPLLAATSVISKKFNFFGY